MDGREFVHQIGTTGNPSSTSFTVAVQGCSHGELDSIYDAVLAYRERNLSRGDQDNTSHSGDVDALLCCGDVQTLRTPSDFHALNVPPKYRALGDFHAYYSGAKVAPILTVFVGGNHESSNYLQELHYGGWVAPNVYYLGAAGAVNLCKRVVGPDGNTCVASIRIGGLSGIYNGRHYRMGRYESPPYNNDELRSVYHTRRVDVVRMKALRDRPTDVMISHDWPRGVHRYGDEADLVRRKPFFRDEVGSNTLGSEANEELLHALRPCHWFAAHLHVKFEAEVCHAAPKEEESKAQAVDGGGEEKAATDNGDSGAASKPSADDAIEDAVDSLARTTRFLSLDKCLPRRRHIQVVHVEPSSARSIEHAGEMVRSGPWLEYDPSWLAVLRRSHPLTVRTRGTVPAPEVGAATEDEVQEVMRRLEEARASNCDEGEEDGDDDDSVEAATPDMSPLAVPLNFERTVPPFDPTAASGSGPHPRGPSGPPRSMVGNPQTDALLSALGLDHVVTVPFDREGLRLQEEEEESRRRQRPSFGSARPAPSLTPSVLAGRRPAGRYGNGPADCPDENEIDLDDDAGPSPPAGGAEAAAAAVACGDPDEIDLDGDGDEEEGEGEEGGDTVVLKRARVEGT